MSFEPNALPVPDLGLRCRHCHYNLAGLPDHRCPECGRRFAIEDYLPPGDFPLLIFEGRQVDFAPPIGKLFHIYGILCIQKTSAMSADAAFHEEPRRHLAVQRDRYFEAIDLLRRQTYGQPMPDPPVLAAGPDWTCRFCGEENPGSFEICWNCGKPVQGP